ncbi:kinase-like protein [Mytilinidion resinicola]|uniref:Kinase-like protein n=1 Tax=Mytilinidion resinicola TaxID=574789 RepID=A0A6A6YV28_9PEZI|nr:kinase-like protein [Mytilinidion resinicola]KAF2812792.1 kinase-like protein [Mytilinidion resinicola]
MSDRAFASLTPANALARLAFSDVYDALTSRRQADGAQAALRRMLVEPEQTCDDEIVRFRREMERTKHDTDGEASETLTEPDTDTEKQLQELGMVWVGCYLLVLQSPPAEPERGWAAGKGPLENMPIDLLLCTRSFAKSHDINLRNPHARFNFFPESKGFYIIGCSRSPSAQLTVNGDAAMRRPYHLNQHSMNILLDKLEYHFQWEEFAAEDDFKKERGRYVARALGRPANIDVEMPTPLPNKRTMGSWTLGDALGAGGHGRVFFASDQSANVAAIKVVERTSQNCHSVDKEIETLREVTNFVQKSDDGERILRMAEVIYSNSKEFSSKTAFDNVAIVLKPMTPQTFGDLVGTRSKGGCKGMTIEAATAFRDALLGVKVMHDGRWLHRDLKLTNIGLIVNPLRSVLLDVGTSRHIQAGGSLRPEPGTVGTIGYLAPELELDDYDHSIDIWSMGIILFELTYNYHPWKFSINPWRDGKDNEKLRPSFENSYQNTIDKMARDYKSACASPARGYIHLGGLFIEMVRYQWAVNNHAQRPDIDEVLQHPAWGSLLPESPQAKRRRLEYGLEDGEV